MKLASASALVAFALAGADARNETRRKKFALRMSSGEEKVRVIHGSGGGWPAEDSVRMMQPYWDAQNAGGTLLQINSASFMGEGCNQTKAIAEQLQLEFELLPDLQGTACPDGVENQLTVERINNAAGVWFGGGLPGRTVSCMMGFSAEAFGVNSNPEDMASPVLRALWAHPLVGGISAGAMMQPSAALYNGNEISYSPNLANSGSAIRIGEALMNNHGAGFILDQFTIHSHVSAAPPSPLHVAQIRQ